jgi:hypothetical protein
MSSLTEFSFAKNITIFLLTLKQFLIELITRQIICPHQVDKIDSEVIYNVAGSALPYCEKGLSREQVWDWVFERKTLKETLENKDLEVMKLLRVTKDKVGNNISKWKALYQLLDSGIIFLEIKYRMLKVSSQISPTQA